MEDLLHSIIEFLLPHNNAFLYIFLFTSAIVENLFPPIPGDTITAFGAFLVGTGRLDYLLVYISTTLGSVVGFMALFFLGRYLGREFFINRNFSFFSAESIEKTEVWFKKYGSFVILINRFVPGIRSAVSLVSGILQMNPLRVSLLALVSAAVWNLIWIHTGYTLGNNWETVKHRMGDILRNYNMGVGIAFAILITSFILYRLFKSWKLKNSETPQGKGKHRSPAPKEEEK